MSSVHFRKASTPGNPNSCSVLKGNLRDIAPNSFQANHQWSVCHVNGFEALLIPSFRRCNP